jgi:hypothetical protein
MSPKGMLAVFVGYGAGVWCCALAIRKALAFQQARHWPSTSGVVTESSLYRDATSNATHFTVKYEFTIGDRIVGSTPRLSGGWFWSDKQQAAFVRRFAVGQKVEVFYDPRDPKKNCLDREDRSGISALWVIAIGGIALASILVWLQTRK